MAQTTSGLLETVSDGAPGMRRAESGPAEVPRPQATLQIACKQHSASNLRPCPATIWLLGPELHELANNISAPTQVWVLEVLTPPARSAGHLANNTHLAP